MSKQHKNVNPNPEHHWSVFYVKLSSFKTCLPWKFASSPSFYTALRVPLMPGQLPWNQEKEASVAFFLCFIPHKKKLDNCFGACVSLPLGMVDLVGRNV